MAWLLVLIAGLFEIGWAACLKLSAGFTKPLPTVLMVLGLIASMIALGLSLRWIPLSTAYAVWTGIGAAGTAVVGMTFFNEPVSAARIACIGLIVAGIVGLRAAG